MINYDQIIIRALEILSDWQRVDELAERLGISHEDTKALVKKMSKLGLVYRDGPYIIRREGHL